MGVGGAKRLGQMPNQAAGQVVGSLNASQPISNANITELGRILGAMEEEYQNGTQLISQLWELLRPITTPVPCAESNEKSAGASTELNTMLLTRLEFMRDINSRMSGLRDSLNLL